MKILLLGKNGQVGWELQRTLAPLGEVIAVGRTELDLADERAIRQTVRTLKPTLIVNAAAYTAVDQAEEEPELAMAVNGKAPGILAEEASRLRIGLIHYSTDYVFDGTKKEPYAEEDPPNPLNTYGKTKLAGELAVQHAEIPYLIFRTSWVYGLSGKNFLLTILRLAREREELRVVDDQIGTPNWSRMIAEATSLILGQGVQDTNKFMSNNRGIYNLSATGRTSWYNFAIKIIELNTRRNKFKLKTLTPIPTSEYPTPAARPKNSMLGNIKIQEKFGLKLEDWLKFLELLLPDNQP